MQKQLQQLIEFHKAFGVPVRDAFEAGVPESEINLRFTLVMEELREWHADATDCLPAKFRAKELADLLYVVLGTIVTEGLQSEIERVFDAVHASNMSKLDSNGQPIKRADGKLLKGPNYKEPDLNWLTQTT